MLEHTYVRTWWLRSADADVEAAVDEDVHDAGDAGDDGDGTYVGLH